MFISVLPRLLGHFADSVWACQGGICSKHSSLLTKYEITSEGITGGCYQISARLVYKGTAWHSSGVYQLSSMRMEPWGWAVQILCSRTCGLALASVAQLVGASSCKPKGCRFDPPGQGVHEKQLIIVSLPLSSSLPLSLKSISMSSSEDKQTNKQTKRHGVKVYYTPY